MEKVFARVRSPLEISVAVARTSQSPVPLAVIPPRNSKSNATNVKEINTFLYVCRNEKLPQINP